MREIMSIKIICKHSYQQVIGNIISESTTVCTLAVCRILLLSAFTVMISSFNHHCRLGGVSADEILMKFVGIARAVR